MTQKQDFGLIRTIVSIVMLVLFGGTLWATTSAQVSRLEAKCEGDKELWQHEYRSLKETILRIETKVDRLLEQRRLANIGDKHGNP